MSLDLVGISAALYARVKTDAAGAAVRALLGAGAASVIPAHELPGDTGAAGALPARPLLVWREGPVGGSSDEMRPAVFTWWIYDDPGRGERRINAVAAALETAYAAQLGIVPHARVRVGPIGQAAGDRTLSLHGRAVLLTCTERG